MHSHFLHDRARILPGRETVTFTSRPSGSAVSVDGAWREPQSERGRSDQGAGPRAAETVIWNLPAVGLAALTPKLHDAVTDVAGAVYSVMGLERTLLGSEWRLTCVRSA
jgi:hypothetical protein